MLLVYVYCLYLLVLCFSVRGGGLMCMVGLPYNQVVPLSYTRYLNGWTVPLRLLLYLGVMHLVAIIMHGYSLKGITFMLVPEFIYTTCFTQANKASVAKKVRTITHYNSHSPRSTAAGSRVQTHPPALS